MRLVILLLLPLLAGCLGTAPPADGTSIDGAVQAALDALQASGADGARVLEVQLDAGLATWNGVGLLDTVQVPAPSEDPIDALYELSVVLRADIDPHAWPDPLRGEIDLIQQVLDNVPAALNSSNDAVQSHQLLAMAAGGLLDDPGIAPLRDRLLGLQHADGSWGCGPWVGPECTSYALRALAATGGIPADARDAAIAYIEGRREGDAYSDPLNGADPQITAAAIRGLAAVGAAVDDEVIDGLIARQQADGMWHKAGGPSVWVTSEIVLALLAYQGR